MSEEKKDLVPKAKDNVALIDELNPQQFKFLSLIMNRVGTWDAYQSAGYSGNKEAAYALKTRLNKHLGAIALANNMSKEALIAQLSHLEELPITDMNGAPLTSINIKNYIELKKLHNKVLDSIENHNPHITSITINRYVEPSIDKDAAITVEASLPESNQPTE